MSLSKAKLRIAVASMPPLHHSSPDPEVPFDIMKSQVLEWLWQLPDFRNSCWEHMRSFGFLVYDADSRTWAGEAVRERKEPPPEASGRKTQLAFSPGQLVEAVRDMPGIHEGVRVGAIQSWMIGKGHKVNWGTVQHLVSLVDPADGAMDWKTKLFSLKAPAVSTQPVDLTEEGSK